MPRRGASLCMEYCEVAFAKDCAVQVGDGSTALISNCTFEDSEGMGVLITGPHRSYVTILNTDLADCLFGVHVRSGKVDVKMHHTHFEKCKINGIFVMRDVIGTIQLTECKFLDNKDQDLLYLSGSLLDLVMEGALMPQDDQKSREEQVVLSEIALAYDKTTQYMSPCTVLRVCRYFKDVGNTTNHCWNCKTLEPDGVKYKICPECKFAAYCSRECQVEHRIEHNSICVVKKAKNTSLSSVGYLMCAMCRVPENILYSSLFVCRACSKQRYCSKRCQRRHWPEHKLTCSEVHA